MEAGQISLLTEAILDLSGLIRELNTKFDGAGNAGKQVPQTTRGPSEHDEAGNQGKQPKQVVLESLKSKLPVKTFREICLYKKDHETIKKTLFQLLKKSTLKSIAMKTSSAATTEIPWTDLIPHLEKEEFWSPLWSTKPPEESSLPSLAIRWDTARFRGVHPSCRYFIFDHDGQGRLGEPIDDDGDSIFDEYEKTRPWGRRHEAPNSVIRGRIWNYDFGETQLMPLTVLEHITIITEALSFDAKAMAFKQNIGVSFTAGWSKRKRVVLGNYRRSFAKETGSAEVLEEEPRPSVLTFYEKRRKPVDEGKDAEPRSRNDGKPPKRYVLTGDTNKAKKKTAGEAKDDFQARVFAAFHIRCLDKSDPVKEPDASWGNCFRRKRESWEAEFPFGSRTCFREVTATVTLSTQCDSNQPQPFYTICVLTDDTGTFEEPRSEKVYLSRYQGCGRLFGISIFQTIVSSFLNDWAKRWREILLDFNTTPKVDMREALNETWAMSSMFDDNFKQIACCVSAIQILRIFRGWIVETSNDVDELCRAARWSWNSAEKKHIFSDDERQTLAQSFKALVDEKQLLSGRVLALWQQKMDEVQSLRDGMADATALQESRKSAHMNAYLFIFTLMTIFYLPPSFVTSLFGMHLFDDVDESGNVDEAGTQKNFYITIVLASVVTYVVALTAVWIMVPEEQRNRIRGVAKKLVLIYGGKRKGKRGSVDLPDDGSSYCKETESEEEEGNNSGEGDEIEKMSHDLLEANGGNEKGKDNAEVPKPAGGGDDNSQKGTVEETDRRSLTDVDMEGEERKSKVWADDGKEKGGGEEEDHGSYGLPRLNSKTDVYRWVREHISGHKEDKKPADSPA